MANENSMLDRIREMIVAAAAIAAVATSVVLIGPETSDAEIIRIAGFNIQVLGKSKLGKPDVMQVLVDVAQQFDILVVQEVRDKTEMTADAFLDLINEEAELTYAMYEGPRLGRTTSKEQYVLYYVPARVQLLFAEVLPDPEDKFEREPLVAMLRAGSFDFTLIICHVKPDDAESELELLASVAETVLDANPAERDVILLGDFNADGRYLAENRLEEIFPPETFFVVITNEMITSTTSENTYDRIILVEGTFGHEYVEDSAQPYRFDLVFGIDDSEFVSMVSDHYPVFAEFNTTLPDDD